MRGNDSEKIKKYIQKNKHVTVVQLMTRYCLSFGDALSVLSGLAEEGLIRRDGDFAYECVAPAQKQGNVRLLEDNSYADFWKTIFDEDENPPP